MHPHPALTVSKGSGTSSLLDFRIRNGGGPAFAAAIATGVTSPQDLARSAVCGAQRPLKTLLVTDNGDAPAELMQSEERT